ncbi:sensor histidine kinase [Microbacterium sp. NPDC055903]
MHTEQPSIREAWSQIPSPGSVDSGFERFTGKRIERILQIAVAIGSVVTGAQALLAAITTIAVVDAPHVTMLVVVFVPLTAMLVACTIGRGVRATSTAFVFFYVGALIAWPLVVDPADRAAGQQPWIFFLINVGSVAAMLAFSARLQYVWAVAVPLVYGAVRLIQGDFSREFWITTAFDVSFTIILGAVLISLGWMFRSVAAGVDDARGRAVASYAAAAATAAAEQERVAVAALMHDSVLAALIAAERAESPRARDLAVGMAREALTRLANTEAAVLEEGTDEPVGLTQVVLELRRVLSETGADAVVEQRGGVGLVPDRVARALVLAARQAIGNSVAHAHGRGLHILAEAHGDEGITVTVSDTGDGFDLDAVDEDRLGIRASIIARMAAVAGFARIVSDGSGTVVELGWERE